MPTRRPADRRFADGPGSHPGPGPRVALGGRPARWRAQPPRGAVDEAVTAMSLSAGAPGLRDAVAPHGLRPLPGERSRPPRPGARPTRFDSGGAGDVVPGRARQGLRRPVRRRPAGHFRARRGTRSAWDHVRLQQVHNGVSVTGGELAAHLAQGGVVAAGGKTLPGVEKVGTTPVLTPIAAEAAVRRALAKLEGLARRPTSASARLASRS